MRVVGSLREWARRTFSSGANDALHKEEENFSAAKCINHSALIFYCHVTGICEAIGQRKRFGQSLKSWGRL